MDDDRAPDEESDAPDDPPGDRPPPAGLSEKRPKPHPEDAGEGKPPEDISAAQIA